MELRFFIRDHFPHEKTVNGLIVIFKLDIVDVDLNINERHKESFTDPRLRFVASRLLAVCNK